VRFSFRKLRSFSPPDIRGLHWTARNFRKENCTGGCWANKHRSIWGWSIQAKRTVWYTLPCDPPQTRCCGEESH
jgi:hypothetical protein